MSLQKIGKFYSKGIFRSLFLLLGLWHSLATLTFAQGDASNFTGPVILGGQNQYFNPNAFIQPLPGTYGNMGRNILQAPGLTATDLSLTKLFSFSERLRLQFRTEVFNFFNHTNLNAPNPVVYATATGGPSPTAGVITGTTTSSRQIQFGLKLLW
jgi:hypothetical protein